MTRSLRAKVFPGREPGMSLATQSSVLGPQVGGASSVDYALASQPSLHGIDESWMATGDPRAPLFPGKARPAHWQRGLGSVIMILNPI